MCFQKELKVGKVITGSESQSAKNVIFHHLGSSRAPTGTAKAPTNACFGAKFCTKGIENAFF